ncbi:unnamed protein product [Strongylus vulgaris]|uniref:DOMON domain-containing protein n=1 Tax=Strongylus vulgaris TaxID=40348 RepID=A0A3P7JUQ8_STRVU|nr:unnamed protein product [Strongylus vulgaris]
MAVGFSNDDSMGSDAVTQCTFPPGAQPSVHFSYNVGKSNVVPLSEADQAAEKQNLKLIHAHKGDDGMYCHFRQRSGNGENRFVPYLNQKHHIFLARGIAKDPRVLDMHALSSDSPNFPYISDKKINVGDVKKREVPAEGPSAPGAVLSNINDTAQPKSAAEPAEPESESLSRQTKYWLFRFHGIV